MRRYRQILAMMLAASLMIGSIVTPDTIKASNTVETENISETTTDSQESSEENELENNETEAEENREKDAVKEDVENTEKVTEEVGTTENVYETEQIEDVDATEEYMEEEYDIMLLDGNITLEQLASDSSNSGVTVSGDSITVTLAGLVLLSNCSADSYQNKTIQVESTGSTDITGNVTYDGVEYQYQGIGTTENPFSGVLSAGQITLNTTLFGAITSNARITANLIWTGDGSKPLYSKEYIFQDNENHTLLNSTDQGMSVSIGSADGATMGTLIGKVTGEAGTLIVGSGVTYPENKSQIAVSGSENAGLICNTLEKGIIQLEGFSFPTEGYSVTATSGNAGGIVGLMESETGIKADTNTNIQNLSVTANNGNAGGIVGEIAEGARLIADSGKAFELSAPSVTASGNEGCAGGIAGKATESDGTTILSPIESTENTDSKPFRIITPTVNGKNAGGLFGNYIIKSRQMDYPASVNLNMPTILTSGNGGGLFGVLDLQNTSSYTIDNFTFECTKSGNENNSTYGSLIGQVKGTGTVNALYINNCNVKSAFNNNNTRYHGGLIGMVGGDSQDNAIYVEVNGGTAADSKIHIEVTNPLATGKFGGIIGCLSKGSILKMTGIVEISTTANISQGGGIIGHAAEGSAVEFNGTTDLSAIKYEGNNSNIGQLIGSQESALIYARGDGNGNGWAFKRTTGSNTELNDIGSYGEVIRLQSDSSSTTGLDKDLIGIDQHKIELKKAEYSGEIITLATKEELALLAITWQTHGYFSADNDINTGSWTELRKKNIKLSDDIDLAGTGILGIERDSEDSGNNTYKGNFEGNAKKISLAIGEVYGLRNGEKVTVGDWGSGQIHTNGSHKNLGIFSLAAGSVSNLTISGFIYANSVTEWGDIGGYAAQLRGNGTFETIITNVTAEEIVKVKTGWKNTKIGGIYGECIGTFNIKLNNCTLNSNIAVVCQQWATGSGDYAGGFIGMYRDNSSGITIDCNSVIIGTKISTEGQNIHAGGLIGDIRKLYASTDTKRTINISNIQVNNYKLEVSNSNNNTNCGGILGYLWVNTDVNFNTPADTNTSALTVTNAEVNAPDASVGGLVYRGSGKWQIADRGIDIQQATFHAGKLGLLLCHAENSSETNNAALYLEMRENWKNAYKLGQITIEGNPAVFDEIIAYTTDSASNILDNNKNAVISLAIEGKAGIDTTNCNTYVNRTDYGKSVQTNSNSRYYYNLDQILASQSNGEKVSGWLDTPEKLMIWDVYTYASESLKNYFPVDKDNISGIGTDNDSKVTIDLSGYSYYPVDIGTMTIQNADITFANEIIEAKEKSNKSTQGTNDSHTQHYAMHCGFFRNMTSSEEVTTSIKNVIFKGTIGKVNGTSGVLSFGNIEGNANVNPQRFHVLNFSQVEFSDFGVTDAGTDYAPVLLNSIGSYTTLNFNDIKAIGYGDTPKKAAGSSLIGKVGGNDKTQISLSFNKMKFPDKSYGNEGGIFTHATFLESFQYKNGGIGTAIYNFYKAEDWNGTTHKHDVTYGKEISDSVEYENLQHWYYDEETYEKPEGYVRSDISISTETPPKFTAYLPYVYSYKKDNLASHEIKVNQRIADLLDGCGTYGHPYKISTVLAMKTIADYIATATPQTGWKVQVTGDQSAYHTTVDTTDRIYEYDGTVWHQIQKVRSTDDSGNTTESWQQTDVTVSNDMMHTYILSAYYDIKAKEDTDTAKNKVLELENFAGLGTELYPFRGVIVSNNKSTVKISGNNIANGLIVYSYGSVIKDLTIQYSGSGKSMNYQAPDAEDYQPKSFFGGVIGCIMGGDNIIDNVTVSMSEDWKLTLDGDKNYLIQAGEYVGSVAGGGVIFRNIEKNSNFTGKSVYANSSDVTTSLYVNPYVGRVLDGYAFSEGCTIDNGTDNYKINELQSELNDITTNADANNSNNYTTIIHNAQGLLLMSAIINSGAASAGGTYAYYGTEQSYSDYKFGNGVYGKVRNATYQYVGKDVSNEAEADFQLSKNDDRAVPAETNAPYLITKYSNGKTFLIAGNDSKNRKKVQFELDSKSTYDMKDYGNGYQGISARYLSNAANAGTNTLGTVYVKPYVKGFNGNDSVIKVTMQMKEYADDDFHGISFGGVFNLIWAVAATELTDKVLAQNLKIEDTEISMAYCNAAGSTVSEVSNMKEAQGKYCVGVGGFAGNSAQNSLGDEEKASYVFQHISISNSNFSGPICAGGLMGSAGLGNNEVKSGAGQLLNVNKNGGDDNRNNFGVNLVNCKYDHLNITAQYAAGGMVGGLFCNRKNISFESRNSVKSSVSVSEEAYEIVGQNSSIQINNSVMSTNTYAGGIFGTVGTALYINDKTFTIKDIYQSSGKKLRTIQIQDVTITNPTANNNKFYGYAGGIIGSIQENHCYVYHTEIKKSDSSNAVISGILASGGAIGYVKLNWKTMVLQDCQVNSIQLQDTAGACGGLIGILEGSGSGSPEMKITECDVQSITSIGIGNASIGGMVGLLRYDQPFVIQSCKISGSLIGSENDKNGYNGGFIGGITQTYNAKVSVFDSVLEKTKIYGNPAGGISSIAHGSIYGSNILLKDVEIQTKGKGGFIAASMQSASDFAGLYMAGISIKGSSNVNGDKTLLTNDTNFSGKSYVALADYEGTSMTVQSQGSTAGISNLLDVEAIEPYVVTSPRSSMSVIDENGAEKYLYGDSTSWSKDGENYKLEAQKILEEAGTKESEKFVYKNIGVTLKSNVNPDGFDFSTVFSTYNQNQSQPVEADFPVLMITGDENSQIESYLNIVTNGAYTQARNLNGTNGTHVTAQTKVYNYDANKKKFVASNDELALHVMDNGKKQMSFLADATNYDNQKNRFTLLTVTFTENGHEYNVQVPIIVRRILEMDFIATLSYGTHFRSDDYTNLTGHILDSFGNAMTGYLTYAYNSSLGKASTFGWQNYVDAGGDVTQAFAKSVQFDLQRGKIPAGTQFTLVDCQDKNKKAYFYTVTEEDEAKNKKVFWYTDFVASDGVTKYQDLSIGEAMEVTVEQKNTGKFIEVNADGRPVDANGKIVENIGTPDSGIRPTVALDGKYYRLPKEGENASALDKYAVTLDDDVHNENYYLVITFPETADKEPINGYITTNIKGNIPMHLTDSLRQKDSGGQTKVDSHSDTASTFQISSGYVQKLSDQDLRSPARKEIKLGDSWLKVDILDEITFSNEQYYNSSDNLFQKFTGSLSTVTLENGREKINSSQFPAGTKGTVEFYVYSKSEDKTYKYYRYDSVNHSWNISSTRESAISYPWISEGYNMELLLSEDGTAENAVNLQQVRSYVKGDNRKGESTFYVEAVLDAELPASGIDIIPTASLVKDVPDEYAKLGYVSQLSTEKESLSYSSNRALLAAEQTNVKYYRNFASQSTLSYDADEVNQLGINLYDLGQNVDRDGKNVIISTTAEYDLSMLQGIEKILGDSEEVRFSLNLWQKDENSTETYKILNTKDVKDYLDVQLVSEHNNTINFDETTGTWSWSIPKEVYWDAQNKKINTSAGLFDGEVFLENVNLLVRIDNIEDGHYYSNYKVELKADIIGKDGSVLNQPDPESDYIIYTLAKIRPEFVEQ